MTTHTRLFQVFVALTTFLCGLCSVSRVVVAQPMPPTSPAPNKPNPEMQAVLDTLKTFKPRPLPTLTPAQARVEPASKYAARVLAKRRNNGVVPPREPVGSVREMEIPARVFADNRPRTVRVYTPLPTDGADATTKPPTALPILVFVHGGGWMLGSIEGYDESARALCNLAQCVVVSVSYRYAPENPFPAAHEDVYASFLYIAQNAASFGGTSGNVAIGGESAGGNLSAGVCLMLRDRNAEYRPVHQLLIYPVTDTRRDKPSYRQYRDAMPLDEAQMILFFRNVAGGRRGALESPYLAPLRAPSLRDLPSATILTAEIDPIRDDGRLYAARLEKSDVAVRYKNYIGVTHEFFSMNAVVSASRSAQEFAAAGLRAAFAHPSSNKTGMR